MKYFIGFLFLTLISLDSYFSSGIFQLLLPENTAWIPMFFLLLSGLVFVIFGKNFGLDQNFYFYPMAALIIVGNFFTIHNSFIADKESRKHKVAVMVKHQVCKESDFKTYYTNNGVTYSVTDKQKFDSCNSDVDKSNGLTETFLKENAELEKASFVKSIYMGKYVTLTLFSLVSLFLTSFFAKYFNVIFNEKSVKNLMNDGVSRATAYRRLKKLDNNKVVPMLRANGSN